MKVNTVEMAMIKATPKANARGKSRETVMMLEFASLVLFLNFVLVSGKLRKP